jgi:hypothetical protein
MLASPCLNLVNHFFCFFTFFSTGGSVKAAREGISCELVLKRVSESARCDQR